MGPLFANLVQTGLHALSLQYTGLYRVHSNAVSGKPEDAPKRNLINYSNTSACNKMARSKKTANEKVKSKGVLANARVLAHKSEAAAAAKTKKRKAPESDEEDELIDNNDGEEEEEEEEEEEGASSSSSSDVAVETQSTRAEIKKGAAELAVLKDDEKKIKGRIAAAKEKNAAKVQELLNTHNDYPAEVSALICCLPIGNSDFCLIFAL